MHISRNKFLGLAAFLFLSLTQVSLAQRSAPPAPPINNDDFWIGEMPPTPPPPAGFCPNVVTSGLDGDKLNVRQGPGIEYDVIGMLEEGVQLVSTDYVDFVDPTTGAYIEWVQVDLQGLQFAANSGWVSGKYVTCMDDVIILPPEPQEPKPTFPDDVFFPEPEEELCAKADLSKKFTWPVPESRKVIMNFGAYVPYMSCGFHSAMDIAGKAGAAIVAVAAGRVEHVGPLWLSGEGVGRGPFAIVINHGDGIYSTYSHNSAASVSAGDCVSAGEKIGELGALGYAFMPNLHLEILKNAQYTGSWERPFENVCSQYVNPSSFF